VKARSCAELAELRSAYVDGALGDEDRERLLAHLVDCGDCRRDVAELRHVRSLLTGSTDPGYAPVDLSHRLVSIAGDEATEPLWTRPFRRTAGGGQLPSHRHAVRSRVVAGVLACGLAMVTVLGVGYVSAPQAVLAAVDPTSQAVTEFTTVVSAFPLDSRVSAAFRGREPTVMIGAGYPTEVSLPAQQLSEAKATELLVQAGQAGDELSYTGTQIVTVTRDDERLSNTVRISSRGGRGTELSPDHSGQLAAKTDTYVESDSSTRMADADLIDRLATRYALRGWKSQRYANRSAYVVEAVEPTADPSDGTPDGVAARWWIDADTSLLLGQETYDRGKLVVSSRLVDLQLDAVADDTGVASGPTARTTATLTLSRAGKLRRDGWICADRLAGLQLVRLRTDRTADPDLVHLVYSDGLTTLSVVEQRGRLAGAPSGTIRNETLGAWVSDEMPATATWTSGDVVLTAVTDGSREALAAAVAALPHAGLQRPTTMERVRAGWSRILGR
jgi:anti-sigma factor RsiW